MKPKSIDRKINRDIARWLHWLETCPSTNTWAIAHFADLQHGDVVFTQRQTAGRGQHNRTWHAPTGVLTASIVLQQVPAVHLPGLSLAAGLAAIYAVEDLLPSLQGVLRLKWPNDVLIDGRKLAGILCEVTHGNESSQTSSSSKTQIPNAQVVVGIGLNCYVEFAQAELGLVGNAVSLHQVSSFVPDELPLLERLRHYLLQAATLLCLKGHGSSSQGLSALLPDLRHRDALLGSNVTLDLQGKQFSGQAAGIDECGRLLLLLPDGKLRAFASGSVLKRAENKSARNES